MSCLIIKNVMCFECIDNIFNDILYNVWLGASLDKVYICLVLYIDHLIKFDTRTSCDDILDHPSHHGHIVYRKVCMHASIHSKWC